MSRVLITGATGFTGVHLLAYYAARGWEVHGTHRSPDVDHAWIPAHAVLHRVDLLDLAEITRLMIRVRPNVIHHLAAQSSGAVASHDSWRTLETNARTQYNTLEAIRTVEMETRIVVAGSSDEYGQTAPECNPIDEHAPLLPTTPYALSKVIQDVMAYQYFASHHLHIVRTRPFLQLGPRRSDHFVAGAFARQVAEIVLGRREPVILVGNIDLQRDFTDVRDVADAYGLLAEHGEAGEVYNIASGIARTLREMLTTMLEVAGVQAEIQTDASRRRPGEAPLLVGDPAKLHAATGWTPSITFQQSVTDTLAFWLDHLQASG